MKYKHNKPTNRSFNASPLRAPVIASLIAGILVLAGCAGMNEPRPTVPGPVTVAQIVKMSKDGVPAQQIIDKMRRSRTVYRLKASELAKLKQEGVPDAVIDYMQQTYLDATRREERNRYHWSYLGYWGYPYPYWYGWAPFGGWIYWDGDDWDGD
ncbi:MAG: hypothetical protein P8Z49_10730 [Acidobacteriota bacterium]